MLLASGLLNWVHRLGGLDLIMLGLADNSVVPLPGSVDALTIVLAASNKEWWWTYAIGATIGAVIGGFPPEPSRRREIGTQGKEGT